MSSRKRAREHSTSPIFHRVAWTTKRSRRGTVATADVITTPGSLKTPVKSKNHTSSPNVQYSRDQTPITGKGIEAAMSLPPIPAPEFLASKKARGGKV